MATILLKLIGAEMLKRVLINWLLPMVMDLAIQGLQRLSAKSDNDIDDRIVAEILNNKDKLMDEIKAGL